MDQVPTDYAALQAIKKIEFPNKDVIFQDDQSSINFSELFRSYTRRYIERKCSNNRSVRFIYRYSLYKKASLG